jgi:hypothetical protein
MQPRVLRQIVITAAAIQGQTARATAAFRDLTVLFIAQSITNPEPAGQPK